MQMKKENSYFLTKLSVAIESLKRVRALRESIKTKGIDGIHDHVEDVEGDWLETWEIKMKVKDLETNMLIVFPNSKGILKITDIKNVEHNTYEVSFYGIKELSLLDGDIEVTVI